MLCSTADPHSHLVPCTANFPCPHLVVVSVSRPLLLCSIVDFPRWFKTNDSYPIAYQEGFEPYVLVSCLIQQAGEVFFCTHALSTGM